jgi:hypothetical protein
LRTDQRVVDIAGHVEPALLDARIEAGQVDPVQHIQCTAARREIGAAGVEQAAAQRLQHARAAVVGGAAADAQHEAARAGIQRMADQLPGAEAGGRSGLRCAGGTSSSPLAAAISITAVWPSPIKP